jgi:hypothetical protein
VKAILVLEMPNSCSECPLFGSHYSDMTCRANGRGINYPYPKEVRQDWCPLRLAPEKRRTTDDFWQGCVNIVRNHCIDEILGDKE